MISIKDSLTLKSFSVICIVITLLAFLGTFYAVKNQHYIPATFVFLIGVSQILLSRFLWNSAKIRKEEEGIL